MNYVIEPDPAYPGMWQIVKPDYDEATEYYQSVRQIATFEEAEEIRACLLAGVTVSDYDEARKRGVQ